MTEDEMVGWHHRCEGHEFELALGVGEEQGRLACFSPWGHKESGTTEWLTQTDSHLCKCILSHSAVSDSLRCQEL